MKAVMSCTLFIALLFASVSFAQEYQLGVRLDARHFTTNTENVPDPSYAISSIQIFGTVIFNEKTGLEARFGLDGNHFYEGTEIGILSKYYFNDFYAVGGIVYHHMAGYHMSGYYTVTNLTADGNNYGLRRQDLFLPSLGLGYSPLSHFSVEVMLQHGLNKKVGYYDDYSAVPIDNYYYGFHTIGRDIRLTWLVNLGLSYSFSL